MERWRVRLSPSALSITTMDMPLTCTCLCRRTVSFGTSGRTVMLRRWAGNRRSGVALAMCHRLCGTSTYTGSKERDRDEDFRLWNDLYCVGWGVKLYSLTHCMDFALTFTGRCRHWCACSVTLHFCEIGAEVRTNTASAISIILCVTECCPLSQNNKARTRKDAPNPNIPRFAIGLGR